MWEGEGGSEELKEMGVELQELEETMRDRVYLRRLPFLVEGKEPWRWPKSERHSPLLCLVSFSD